jgi:titin
MHALKPASSTTATPQPTPTPSPQIANPPSAPSVTQGSGSNLTVTWSAPLVDSTHDAATAFNLRFAVSGTGTWASVTSVASPYVLSGLAAGTAYDVQVQSVNAAGTSAWSATDTLTTSAAGPYTPNTPAAPSLAQGTGSNLTVTWYAPATSSTASAATSYNLRFSPSGANTWTSVAGVTSPYTLTGLSGSAAYDVQVQSANTAGTSGWSATSTLTTAAGGPFVPNVVAAPALAQGTGSNLTVTWTAPAADATHSVATSYNVRSSPSGAGTWTTVSNVTSPYTLSGLTAGMAYDVEVESANAAGTSAWSVTSTLTTAAVTPYIPNIVVTPTVALGTGSNLTVTWTAPAADGTHSVATSYNLRSSPSGAGTWTTVSGVTSPYNLSGLIAGAAYDVQVQSANSAGSSAWSATATLTTATAIPNTLAAPALAQGSGSNLTVTWSASAADGTHGAATSYNLRSSPSGAGTWTLVSGVVSPYTLSGLTAGAAYDVQVQSANAAGTGAWSATSTLTTSAGAGPYAPNIPAIASVAPPADGTASKLTVTWPATATDATHGAPTSYNLRYGPSGSGTWTTVSSVTSPYAITGLGGATAIDVEVQATNAVGSSAWSSIKTGTTWGATVAPGGWTAAAAQVHGTSVAPNGGVQAIATAAPTAVTGFAFAWSQSNTAIPTTGLLAAAADGTTNGWGQYISAPATAGTYYLWMLAQGTGSVTTGALVTSAITVS